MLDVRRVIGTAAILPALRARPARRSRRNGRGGSSHARAGRRDAHRYDGGRPPPCPHAGQLRRLRGRSQARRHPGRGHQRIREPPGLLRLGRAVRAHAEAELDEMARGVRPARARGRGRAQGPPAPEDRGVRRLAVRRARTVEIVKPKTARRAAGSARSTSSSARTTCCRCATARSIGFADVRARTEREPELLRHGVGLRALRADGQRRRPLLPGARRARDASSRASRSSCSRAHRRAARSRRSTGSSAS